MPGEGLDVDALVDLPRIASLHLSPDGSRLVATVQAVAGGKRYAGALWEVDPGGRSPARRLTHSAKGESAQGFLPDGSVLFLSDRPDLDSEEGRAQEQPALYVLPARGGEPRKVMAPPGGISAVAVARDAPVVAAIVSLHPGAEGFEQDEKREKARKDAGVQAQLFDRVPIRYWDHHVGPREPRVMRLDLSAYDGDAAPEPQDLTPTVPWLGWLEEPAIAIRPDGGMVAVAARTGWGREFQAHLAVVEQPGSLRVLLREDGDHAHLAWSPDARRLAANLVLWGRPDCAESEMLVIADPQTGEREQPAPEWQSWVTEIAWAPDSSALYAVSHEQGRMPVFRVELDGRVTRLCRDGSFTHLCPSPDGSTLYALRSHVDAPPAVVALDARAADQAPRHVWSAARLPEAHTRTEELTVTAPDGAEVQCWLVLPESASAQNPAPLLTMIHGGPLMAFSAWSFRWNPLVFAARGWAVLMPNPRLSVGFSREHVAAAWNNWADLPAADVLAAVEAVAARPDVDGTRVAASGGSYGGYMANWLAGHSNGRFKAIVTHASLWAMDQFHGTTDYGPYMERSFGDPYVDLESWMRQSPHRSIGAVRTPMLVIHGERDARVPVAEAIRLFTDLQLNGVPSQFLYFPDEHHWVLKPQNARVWYRTFIGFIEEHVLGRAPQRHELL